MARGRKTSLSIRLTPAVRQTLLAWQRAPTIPAGRVRRGRMILLVADGMSISAVAATVGISRRFVYKWVRRFLAQGLEGLADKPGRRRVPPQAPPAGAARPGAVLG
jgi:DNA invertase Pin-like site-specific DNA recombinase